MSSGAQLLSPPKRVVWATARRHPRLVKKVPAEKRGRVQKRTAPSFSTATTKVAGMPDLEAMFAVDTGDLTGETTGEIDTGEFEAPTSLAIPAPRQRRGARRRADSVPTNMTASTRQLLGVAPPPIPRPRPKAPPKLARPQLALPARTTPRPAPSLPGLPPVPRPPMLREVPDRPLPGLAQARAQRALASRAPSVNTLSEEAGEPPAAVDRDTDAATGRHPLIASAVSLIGFVGVLLGAVAAVVAGFGLTAGTASAAILLAAGATGAIAAVTTASLIALTRPRSSAAFPVIVGSAGGIGFAIGWLLRLMVPNGLMVDITDLAAVPAIAATTLDAGIASATTHLATPELAGAWLAELMLTLVVIASSVRWAGQR